MEAKPPGSRGTRGVTTPRRVVVIGSESTGKTTLARRLAERHRTVWVREYARAWLDAKGSPLDESDVEPIARGQISAEDEAAWKARELVVLDTSILSTVVYATHYYGACPDWIVREAHARRDGLYLLTDIDVPWVAEPQRDRGSRRAEMHALFVEALESRALPYVLVRGEWDERWRIACAAVESSGEGRGVRGEEA